MDDIKNTSLEGNQTGTEGTQQEKTFTQEEVNRIVQERLARSKGNINDDLEKRAAELDLRERKLNATAKLRENGLPDYLVDALNMSTDEAFEKSIEAIKKMKGEEPSAPRKLPGTINPIGIVTNGGGDPLKDAFGLR